MHLANNIQHNFFVNLLKHLWCGLTFSFFCYLHIFYFILNKIIIFIKILLNIFLDKCDFFTLDIKYPYYTQAVGKRL